MIYICFGMTKSASTFLYQLTEETFRAAGRKPARLRPPLQSIVSTENYFDDIDPELIDAIARAVGARDVVLKTHQVLHPGVAERIEAGAVLASASIRDPREMALAMVDHGRRSRRQGRPEFAECRTVFDTWASIDYQVENMRRWLMPKPVELFLYNAICFETAAVVSRIAAQIGAKIDVSDALRPFRSKRTIGRFNKGAALRYREMPAQEQAAFLERYQSLYAAFCFDTPTALEVAQSQEGRPPRPRGALGHLLWEVERAVRF